MNKDATFSPAIGVRVNAFQMLRQRWELGFKRYSLRGFIRAMAETDPKSVEFDRTMSIAARVVLGRDIPHDWR